MHELYASTKQEVQCGNLLLTWDTTGKVWLEAPWGGDLEWEVARALEEAGVTWAQVAVLPIWVGANRPIRPCAFGRYDGDVELFGERAHRTMWAYKEQLEATWAKERARQKAMPPPLPWPPRVGE